jgi:transposase
MRYALYPTIEKAYNLAQAVTISLKTKKKDVASLKLAHWHNKVEKSQLKSCSTITVDRNA